MARRQSRMMLLGTAAPPFALPDTLSGATVTLAGLAGSNIPVTGADLRAAAQAVLDGRAPASRQTPSVGCSIKWKAGREPDWALS